MANKKFLDSSGVKRLWDNVVRIVSSESARAKSEEKRIEEKIAEMSDNAYVEGEGINVTLNENGQKVISLEQGAINSDHIESISISKLISAEGQTVIFNGGNANG